MNGSRRRFYETYCRLLDLAPQEIDRHLEGEVFDPTKGPDTPIEFIERASSSSGRMIRLQERLIQILSGMEDSLSGLDKMVQYKFKDDRYWRLINSAPMTPSPHPQDRSTQPQRSPRDEEGPSSWVLVKPWPKKSMEEAYDPEDPVGDCSSDEETEEDQVDVKEESDEEDPQPESLRREALEEGEVSSDGESTHEEPQAEYWSSEEEDYCDGPSYTPSSPPYNPSSHPSPYVPSSSPPYESSTYIPTRIPRHTTKIHSPTLDDLEPINFQTYTASDLEEEEKEKEHDRDHSQDPRRPRSPPTLRPIPPLLVPSITIERVRKNFYEKSSMAPKSSKDSPQSPSGSEDSVVAVTPSPSVSPTPSTSSTIR